MQGLGQGIALFLGVFTLLNLAGGALVDAFDATMWWIDLRLLPAWAGSLLVLMASLAMLAFAVAPAAAPWRRRSTGLVVFVLLGIAIQNTFAVWSLDASGQVDAGFPVPLSLVIAIALLFVLIAVMRSEHARGDEGVAKQGHAFRRWFAVAMVSVSCAVLFPVAQMFCFGSTDYRRKADVAVVLGCLAYADGTPSMALADRVRTSVELYHQGLATSLVFSGGPGVGDIHETEAMRRFAVELGVPSSAIVLDLQGLNTQHTVDNTVPMLRELGANTVLVVSNFYHLPRVKLTYQRAGVDVLTVPAHDTRRMKSLPYNMAREVAALWLYYVRPLLG